VNSTTQIALIAATAALLGALIGALAPIVVGIVTSRAETRREHLRIAAQLALVDDKAITERAAQVIARTGAPVAMPPIAITFIYHLRLLVAAGGGSRIEPHHLLKLRAEVRELMQALKKDCPIDFDSL
jgi:hypothetical protein